MALQAGNLLKRVGKLERAVKKVLYRARHHGSRHDAGGADPLSTVPDHDHTGDAGDGAILTKMILGPPTELTIASGVITVTQSYHLVDTEADNSTDDLDTILGGVDGMILVLSTASNARDVTLKTGTDNINLGSDVTLVWRRQSIVLLYSGAMSRWLRFGGM